MSVDDSNSERVTAGMVATGRDTVTIGSDVVATTVRDENEYTTPPGVGRDVSRCEEATAEDRVGPSRPVKGGGGANKLAAERSEKAAAAAAERSEKTTVAAERSFSHDGGVNRAPQTGRPKNDDDPDRAIVRVLDRVDSPSAQSAAVGGCRKVIVVEDEGERTDAAFSVLPSEDHGLRVEPSCGCADCRKKLSRPSSK